MLYVDDTAMIAPINITDNNNASFNKAKADLLINFMKLGKHIMISGGSWVFNKKDKGKQQRLQLFQVEISDSHQGYHQLSFV